MRQRLSLAGQLLLLQLAIVLLVVGAVAAVSIAEADASFRRVEGERLRSVGENAAINRTVRLGLATRSAGTRWRPWRRAPARCPGRPTWWSPTRPARS